ALLTEHCKVSPDIAAEVRRLIDKKDKMDLSDFKTKLHTLLDENQSELAIAFLTANSLDDIPQQLQAHPAVSNLKQLITMLQDAAITNVVFDPSLMRGFDYYTDI